jgi:hypothetical protein
MSKTITRSNWAEGISLETVPYEQQPKVIVQVNRFEKDAGRSERTVALAPVYCDITDWLQANPKQQIIVLNQIEAALPAGSVDLDDLSWLDELDDAESGDHLIDLAELGLPTGAAGTDIHLFAAYVQYLRDCREQRFIPFSDDSGHAERARQTENTVPTESLSVADTSAALFSGGLTAQQKQLWAESQRLVIQVHPKKGTP